MRRIRIRPWFQLVLCGASLTCPVACSEGAAPGHAVTTQAVGPACTVGDPDNQWVNQSFVAQTGLFHAAVTAIPGASPIDAVIGFGSGPASWFPDLAAIVRFNPSGRIDVRSGSDYQADVDFPYTAGSRYNFGLDIDVSRHVYSVAVVDESGQVTFLARNYPFRTEQAQVGQLDHMAIQVDSDAGSLSICGMTVVKIDTSCPLARADGGFLSQSIGQPGTVVVSSDFVATPDQLVDGVIGLSANPATSFNDLAATVRFTPNGLIEARNGDQFQADVVQSYFAGASRRMRIIANVATHTFSAYVAPDDHHSVQLASRYAFRPTQAHTGFLGVLNAIVDSPQGIMSICNTRNAISVGVRSLREGNYAVAPLPTSHEALISSATGTLRVAGDGATLSTLAAPGGQVAVDPAGNVYIARIAGTDLVLDAYTADFVLRWTRTRPVGTDRSVLAIGADAASVVVGIGLGSPESGNVLVDVVARWLGDGTASTVLTGIPGNAMAIGPAGFVVANAGHGNLTVTVSKWSFGQTAPDWQQTWANHARVVAMALSPSGNVYFGGPFFGPINFGGPTLQPQAGGPGNAFAVALTATGAHLFTTDIHQSDVRSMASNGTITAISAMTGPAGPRLVVLEQTGLEIRSQDGRTGFGSLGNAGSVAVDRSSRVYWNFAEAWPSADAPAYPYLISLDPGM